MLHFLLSGKTNIDILFSSAVLPVCTTFHDILWAHMKTLIDQQVESELCDSMLPQAYWKHTLSLDSILDTMGGYFVMGFDY